MPAAYRHIPRVRMPAVVVAWAERQRWPRCVRLVRAAYFLELATAGVVSISVADATIVEVQIGDRVTSVVLRTATHFHLHLHLESASPSDLAPVGYWQAEALPVLLGRERMHARGGLGALRSGQGEADAAGAGCANHLIVHSLVISHASHRRSRFSGPAYRSRPDATPHPPHPRPPAYPVATCSSGAGSHDDGDIRHNRSVARAGAGSHHRDRGQQARLAARNADSSSSSRTPRAVAAWYSSSPRCSQARACASASRSASSPKAGPAC